MERSWRAPERDLDTGVIASHIQSILAHTLQGAGAPVEIVVRVERDRVELRVVPPAPDRSAIRSFSAWFRDRLRERSLTQEAAARMLGVSAKTVNRWSRGDTEPRFRELVMLYERLGESPFLPERVSAETRT